MFKSQLSTKWVLARFGQTTEKAKILYYQWILAFLSLLET